MKYPGMINEFLELAAFSVPSGHEKEIRACLKNKLTALGFSVSEDQCFPETGSGNLYGRLDGVLPGEPILFAAHMDTVTPCENKRIALEPDGRIHTDGTTILGGDDLTGVVELLQAIRSIKASGAEHRTIEVVFTASEEYFVEGARRLDYDRITAKEAYVLDTDGDIGRAVNAAPTGIRILADFHGKAAHAALKPEDGRNAVVMASAAVARMHLGRIDGDTTANIGIIRGGASGNVVPEHCFVEGETRSLVHEKAMEQARHMKECFESAAEEYGGTVEVAVSQVYPAWKTGEDHVLSRRFAEACLEAGLAPQFEPACGGSDASFLSQHGIRCLVLATGMHEIHSVREYTSVEEMEIMADVVRNLICSRV